MKVLVVDDMPIFREPIEAVLKAERIETASACDGMEALATLIVFRPDLVLLDLGMPVMDGLGVLRGMRSLPQFAKTPVVILSAESDKGKIIQAIKLGISGYILKSGFCLKALLAKVRECAAEAPKAPRVAEPEASGPAVRAPTASPPSRLAPDATMVHAFRSGKAALAQSINDLRPLLSRSELSERLKACEELKGFSPAVSEVLKLTGTERSSMNEVSKAISLDQALSLKVLRVANSSLYFRGDRADTVMKAVQRIGTANIRQVVMNLGVVERFDAPVFKQHVNTAQFWEHSIACAILASDIARSTGATDPESAFTAGLLHDMGRVILAEVLGDHYLEVMETARKLSAPVELVESRMLFINHAEAMDRVLSAWKFPIALVDPIRHHHLAACDVRTASPVRYKEVLCLGLADRLAHALALGDSGNEVLYPIEEHCRMLSLSGTALASIESTAQQRTDEARLTLLMAQFGQEWPRRTVELQSRFIRPFAPLYVGIDKSIDSVRMLCSALRTVPDENEANVIITRCATPKDWPAVLQSVLRLEQSRNSPPLPLLVLSDGEPIDCRTPSMGRRALGLGLPAAISVITDALNELLAQPQAQAA